MSLSDLPLSYCTNVHPGRTLDEVIANLDKYAVPVAERYGRPMGVGLWFAASVAKELRSSAAQVKRLRAALDQRQLTVYTLNAFPYGDFHATRVKEAVYRPDWTEIARGEYTRDCAEILAQLLPNGAKGSISTLPIGLKHSREHAEFWHAGSTGLEAVGALLQADRDRGFAGSRLALEPEPCCYLETTEEAIDFLAGLPEHAERCSQTDGAMIRNQIGLCYDICHQAVEFEDAAESIAKIDAAGIRINKVQISNAIEVVDPRKNDAARAALRDYVDERYLHQTFGLMPDGSIMRVTDLTHEFLDDPGPMLDAVKWRIHYHVPVNQQQIGPLGTTHGEVRKALEAIAKLDYAPHLEVETYTWSVIPGVPGESVDLVAGLAAEMTATATMLDELRAR